MQASNKHIYSITSINEDRWDNVNLLIKRGISLSLN